jgi:stearoyl-CoA desaturase (delta-9 desaturase)
MSLTTRFFSVVAIGSLLIWGAVIHGQTVFESVSTTPLAIILSPLMLIEQYHVLNPLWGIPVVIFVAYQTILTVTVYLHRSEAHSSVQLHWILKHYFRFVKWFTTTMSDLEWVVRHRIHHAFTDVLGDPHSPRLLGVGKILFDGVSPYMAHEITPEHIEVYGKGVVDDRLERNVYDNTRTRVFGIQVRHLGIVGCTFSALNCLAWRNHVAIRFLKRY